MGRYGEFAADLEDFKQVEELPVGVAADGDRGAHMHEVGLGDQDLLGLHNWMSTFSQICLTSFSGMISRRYSIAR